MVTIIMVTREGGCDDGRNVELLSPDEGVGGKDYVHNMDSSCESVLSLIPVSVRDKSDPLGELRSNVPWPQVSLSQEEGPLLLMPL